MTRAIKVGGVGVGADYPVSIQSMTNTQSKNVQDTVKQIRELEEAGCEIVRLAVNDEEDGKAIKSIKDQVSIPIVADIQFDYRLAISAGQNGADCIRINPGNIGSREKVKAVVDICKDRDIPIRIGVNSGSISQDIIDKYGGVNVDSLVESALKELELLESLNFYNTKVSIKSSDVMTNIMANRKFAQLTNYPIHLGLTEAGSLARGSIKSAIGIGSLLIDGIGDTIRVSLSADPVEEIDLAKQILQALGLRRFGVEIVSCPTCARTGMDLIGLVEDLESRLNEIRSNVKIAVMGCVVNGPGEAREADYGITTLNKVGLIFKDGKVVDKVPEEALIDRLIKLVNSQGDIKSE